MYDRTSLTNAITDAVGRSPRGEITVRWRTQEGRRVVEFVQTADWDLGPADPEQTGLPIEPDQVQLTPDAARNAEAIAVYRRSVANGSPITTRDLAARYGMSKTWAHDRILEAR